MTNEQINEFLTVDLFGECWHDYQFSPNGDFWCVKCSHTIGVLMDNEQNYFTGDGMLKVIDAMRAKEYNVRLTAHKEGYRAWFAVWKTCFCDTAPEAVARAAVEFLKAEVK